MTWAVLSAMLPCLPCSCWPGVNKQKQADSTKFKATTSYELTIKHPSPILAPTTVQQQQPTQEPVSTAPPAQDDPDTTLAAIEASIAQDHEAEDHREAQPTTASSVPNHASAPPSLDLNLPRDALPDFSLASPSRLSYWGPYSFSPPNIPLPATPAQAFEGVGQTPFYRSYLAGEEDVRRIVPYVRSHSRLNDVPRRSL